MQDSLAMNVLMEGNKRYITQRGNELQKHATGQSPRAVVVTCADSRVVPEFIFDRDIGEIFTVRVAGNVVSDATVIESIEYAVSHLGVELILIMGHTNCGAVIAAEEAEDAAAGLLKEIQACFADDGDHFLSNIMAQRDALPKRSGIIAEAIVERDLIIKGAIYDLETGVVEFLDD